jgi:hypothetical protein
MSARNSVLKIHEHVEGRRVEKCFQFGEMFSK